MCILEPFLYATKSALLARRTLKNAKKTNHGTSERTIMTIMPAKRLESCRHSSSTLSEGAHHRLDSTDPSVALRIARESLFTLGNLTAGILSEYHDVISSSVLLEKLQAFRVVYEEAVARLQKPSFRIATIGTTSSGKSTIVNALIGRKIAPIEAQEMSAGIPAD
jgi:hypothetical protein